MHPVANPSSVDVVADGNNTLLVPPRLPRPEAVACLCYYSYGHNIARCSTTDAGAGVAVCVSLWSCVRVCTAALLKKVVERHTLQSLSQES